MIFLISVIFLVLVGFLVMGWNSNEDSAVIPFILSIGFFLAFVVSVVCGISVYPDLIAQKQEAVSLQSEIDSVRGSYYKIQSGNMIGGSLDNMQQAQKLSDYIIQYANKKSNYNKELVRIKTIKSMNIYWWFGNAFFISNKVFDLELI